jgi:uncharacterized membrane protein YkoI
MAPLTLQKQTKRTSMKIKTIVFSALATALLAGCATENQAKLMAAAKISGETARQTALAKVPNGTIKAAELEKENGKLQWSFDVATPDTKDITEVNVDAMTGDVISVDKESAALETKEAAKNAAQAPLPKFSHPAKITNPYLPLASLKQDILKNAAERIERTAKPEVHKTFQVGGQSVEALTVEDREFNAAGELIEATRDYFAQDDDGNVYYMGEDVDEYKNGKVSGHSGAWLFGKDTQKLGLLMPAHPKVGDKFKSEDAAPITWEADEVVSLSETATVPAGTYRNCLKIKENASDGDTEYKLYAPNVGCVEEIEGTIPLPLQSHSTN